MSEEKETKETVVPVIPDTRTHEQKAQDALWYALQCVCDAKREGQLRGSKHKLFNKIESVLKTVYPGKDTNNRILKYKAIYGGKETRVGNANIHTLKPEDFKGEKKTSLKLVVAGNPEKVIDTAPKPITRPPHILDELVGMGAEALVDHFGSLAKLKAFARQEPINMEILNTAQLKDIGPKIVDRIKELHSQLVGEVQEPIV